MIGYDDMGIKDLNKFNLAGRCMARGIIESAKLIEDKDNQFEFLFNCKDLLLEEIEILEKDISVISLLDIIGG